MIPAPHGSGEIRGDSRFAIRRRHTVTAANHPGEGGRSPELWLYLKSGKTLKFSGMLSDFDELVGMVNSHMEGLPGPNRDSAAKTRDRDRRARGNRDANWIAGVGIVIIGAVVFVLWRMRLLH